jgi:hypothetical protein
MRAGGGSVFAPPQDFEKGIYMKRVLSGLLVFSVNILFYTFPVFADPARDIEEGIRYHDLAQQEPQGNIDRGKAL